MVEVYLKKFLILVTFGVVVFLGWFYWLFTNDPFNDWWFDKQMWKAQHSKTHQHNVRGKMVYDLKNRVLHRNMTKRQVLQILGPADAGQSSTALGYNIGYWSGFGMDMDIFAVEFNKSGKIAKIYWYQT